jgi:hypothetical protein
VAAILVHTSQGSPIEPTEVDLRLVGDAGLVLLGPPDQLPEKMAAVLTMFEQVDLRGMAVMDVTVPSDPTLTRQE